MGRPKGSLNKSTLLKLQIKDAQGKKAIEVTFVAKAVPVAAPIVIERRPEYIPYYRMGAKRFELLRVYYNCKEIPERIWDKLDKVFLAKNSTEADEAAKRAVDSYSIHLLAAWADGTIPGPAGVNTFKKIINSRRGLVKMLQRKPGNEKKIAEYLDEISQAEEKLASVVFLPSPQQTPEWNTL